MFGSHQGRRKNHKAVIDVNLLMAEGWKLMLKTCGIKILKTTQEKNNKGSSD